MNVFNKLKWVMIVAVVFALVLATNLIDRRSFRNINDSIVSIYEDRLLVKNVILDISTTINKKEVAFLTQDTAYLAANNAALSDTLNSDLLKIKDTNLIEREEEYLNTLKEKIAVMLQSENELIQNQFSTLDEYKTVIREVNETLDVLAHIQMKEGKRVFIRSQKDMDSVELFTQLEIYFLIGLAIIALIIILYKPRT